LSRRSLVELRSGFKTSEVGADWHEPMKVKPSGEYTNNYWTRGVCQSQRHGTLQVLSPHETYVMGYLQQYDNKK